MEGVSGMSKTGREYRYCYCLNQRRKQCTAKPVRKHPIEGRVTLIVESFLENIEILAGHHEPVHGHGGRGGAEAGVGRGYTSRTCRGCTVFEDEASIGAFYKRFACATMGSRETRSMLFEYFIDRIFVGGQTLTIASWFFDGGRAITRADLLEAKQTGEVSNIEFDTSP